MLKAEAKLLENGSTLTFINALYDLLEVLFLLNFIIESSRV